MKKIAKSVVTAGLMIVAMASVSNAGVGINGTKINGLSQQDVGRTLDDSLRNMPLDKLFGAPKAKDQKEVVRRELTDTGFLKTETGREVLKYLVECALPKTVELHAVYEGVDYTFKGGMNLAPNWLDEKPTESEERWVSACMLARTNYFRKKVMISMRTSTEPTPEYLRPEPEEAEATIYEGDFFGNIFAPQPVAYVCNGRRTAEQNQDDILKARICTEVDSSITGFPMPMTWCRFLVTGDCDQPGSHTVNGIEYKENISVYLRPIGERK